MRYHETRILLADKYKSKMQDKFSWTLACNVARRHTFPRRWQQDEKYIVKWVRSNDNLILRGKTFEGSDVLFFLLDNSSRWNAKSQIQI